jgi:hypothetical protein
MAPPAQAIDVDTVKYASTEAIRILLWVLGFMTFRYGTGEFEVTAYRLGCYLLEEHITRRTMRTTSMLRNMTPDFEVQSMSELS